MTNQKSLWDYDERYKKVYEAGGVFWNEHSPNPRLLNFITSLPKGSKCIDFGCGEGHEARNLAKLGFAVTGIDFSPTVIARNTLITPSDLSVDFFVGDVTDLQAIGISDKTFDFALDVGCFHMMNDLPDRMAYLTEVKRILKAGGFFYLQNGLRLDDVHPKTTGEAAALHALQTFRSAHTSDELIARRIKTNQGEKEILLPLLPTKNVALEEYIAELTGVGFSIVYSERSGGANMTFEAIIIARS